MKMVCHQCWAKELWWLMLSFISWRRSPRQNLIVWWVCYVSYPWMVIWDQVIWLCCRRLYTESGWSHVSTPQYIISICWLHLCSICMYMYIVHNTMPHASLEWTQINRSVSINPLPGDITDFQRVSINPFLYILWLHPKPTPTPISPEAKPDKLKIITSATVTKLVTEGSKAGSGRLVVTREGLEARGCSFWKDVSVQVYYGVFLSFFSDLVATLFAFVVAIQFVFVAWIALMCVSVIFGRRPTM